MTLDVARARQHLKEFDFQKLFIELLGWDRLNQHVDITVDGRQFKLNAVAHKRGMVAFECISIDDKSIPLYPLRRKIDQQVTKSVREHIIVYTDPGKTTQVWQWVKREPGRPTACREHPYHKNQPGDALIQKLQAIAFSLAEEESLTIVDVAGSARAGFDVERITKKFYERFKTEHDGLLKFIKGIPDDEYQRWYASVMLNRLMFIYFIQEKGFLDNNQDYLRKKLTESKERGKDKYYSGFLCPLFFEGFAKKETERSPAINKLLGNIPYLNGGLFLKHQIEELHGKTIQIPDSAFEKIFDFFKQYQWHLDERPVRKDDEINPDVLGYIFEKYINQKQMGAYYTKEDITEYISKSTVIPYLFDAAKQKCKIAFERENSLWRLLSVDPDRYIYNAVKHGMAVNIHENPPKSLDKPLPLPKEIAAGLDDVSKRTEWNRSAPAEYALPTEIWREVVARRKRYEEVRDKLAKGEIRDINDFITYNLDIRQLAQDVIETSEGPELLRAFYHAIEKVTVLDPTCGSGAFLFAALNILEPLYEACLDRMQVFLDELDRSGEKHRPEKYSDFKKILNAMGMHYNRRYSILKSIIVNNLYGVDIMEEAIEICKLRLFLKLVAQVGDANKIEPLPDIDFNIRAGNTLVGFATYDEVKKAVTSKLDFENTMDRIEDQAKDIDRLFKRFHEQQTAIGGEITPDDKQELRKRLIVLEDELNRHLAIEYGVDMRKKVGFEKWHDSHRPFHWFIEFYGILKNGGFDVVIGNPPYVEYKNVKGDYKVRNYKTEPCGDLYAFIMERSLALLSKHALMGMIVPISIVSTDGFSTLRTLLSEDKKESWCLNFAERPSKLFVGVEKRLTIWITQQSAKHNLLNLAKYRRWLSEERDSLFHLVSFVSSLDKPTMVNSSMPKVSTNVELAVLERLSKEKPFNSYFAKDSKHAVYYTRKLRYFVQFFDFVPRMTDSKGKRLEPTELKEIHFTSAAYKEAAISILNSSLFYWFFCAFSDVRNVNRREIEAFPCTLSTMRQDVVSRLQGECKKLMEDFKEKSKFVTIDYGAHGVLNIQSFQPRLSKPIIDEIDRVLAKHYGFSDEELDFIINYDIKYRMGREASDENDD